MNLHGDVFGEGPALVLLHGFAGNAATWAAYRQFVRNRRVVAIDLPGHGRSPSPPEGATFEDVVDAVVEAAVACGAEAADWMGYSMGGRMALGVARRHPGRIGRLVIESASPGIRSVEERAERAAADDALAARIVAGGLDAFLDRWASQPLFASQKRLPAATLGRERAVRLANRADGVADGLRAMSVGRQPCLWDTLAEVTMRTLIVVGSDDAKYVAIGREAAGILPSAEFHVVEDAGHTVHLEQPQRFWSRVRSFLEEEGE